MQRRHRSSPHLLEDQIAAHKARLESKRSGLPAGAEHDMLSRQLTELDLATQMNALLTVPRLPLKDGT